MPEKLLSDKAYLSYRPNWAFEEATGRTKEENAELLLKKAAENRHLPIGTIVYYIEKRGDYNWTINWGKIIDHYPSVVVLELYDNRETRIVDGIPYDDLPWRTPFKKLPKKWSYDTKLYNMSYVEYPKEIKDEMDSLDFSKPQNIQKAIDKGYIVPKSKIDYSHIEVEIKRNEGYRLCKKTYQDEYHPPTATEKIWEIFTDYCDAQKYREEHYAEINFEANMTDYEWAVYQIDRTLSTSLYDETRKMEVREILLGMDKVEDIETRFSFGGIQWKYCDNKRWNDI